MRKQDILEALTNYRKSLTNPIYEDTGDDRWIPDIVAGRASHEHQREKISKNPFNAKTIDVGSTNVKLDDTSAKMGFYRDRNTEKYLLNNVKNAKSPAINNDKKEKYIDASELGIRFVNKKGTPMFVFEVESFKSLCRKVDEFKKLPPILCESKIESPKFDYLTWTRDDMRAICTSVAVPIHLGYIVTTEPLSDTQYLPIRTTYNESEIPDRAVAVVPTGLLAEIFMGTDDNQFSESGLFLYVPREEYDEYFMVDYIKGKDGGYIRCVHTDTGSGYITKIDNNFPFKAK